jgi:hypothetical protein
MIKGDISTTTSAAGGYSLYGATQLASILDLSPDFKKTKKVQGAEKDSIQVRLVFFFFDAA